MSGNPIGFRGIIHDITERLSTPAVAEARGEYKAGDHAAPLPKAEIKRDYEYLLRLWEDIRDKTLKSIAPALIYEEEDLVKRAIRDMYDKELDGIWVEGDAGFREALLALLKAMV